MTRAKATDINTFEMKKLRLVLFEACNRKCPGCCNKDWDLKNLPVCNSFEGYDEILLTGGEPMLSPGLIAATICNIRWQSNAKVFVYTAKTDSPIDLLGILMLADGITITIHDQNDVKGFESFAHLLSLTKGFATTGFRSLRVNIFKGINRF